MMLLLLLVLLLLLLLSARLHGCSRSHYCLSWGCERLFCMRPDLLPSFQSRHLPHVLACTQQQ